MFETYECPKCGGKITLPVKIGDEAKTEVLEACRGTFKIEAMVFTMKRLNIGLGDSKMLIQHISSPTGYCGRCATKLLESGITYCPVCNSLNLNW